jgi:hypothetical protein
VFSSLTVTLRLVPYSYTGSLGRRYNRTVKRVVAQLPISGFEIV